MRRAPALLLLTLAAACADPAAPAPPADPPPPPAADPRSSSEATEPDDAPPAAEPAGADLAAEHTAATRLIASDPSRAATLLEANCDRGFAASCVALADLLERGAAGVEPDLDRAHGLLEQACFDGSTVACDRLGH